MKSDHIECDFIAVYFTWVNDVADLIVGLGFHPPEKKKQLKSFKIQKYLNLNTDGFT
jgi:hypothetical protein